MYLFARRRAVNLAQTRAALAAAVEAGSRVSQLTGIPVYTWSHVLSPDVATVAWTCRVEHLDELIEAQDKMAASDELMTWIEQNDSLFSGTIEDSVLQVIHGSATPTPAPFAQVARGVCANGSMSDAISNGIEISEVASRVTGLTTLFGVSLSGMYGGVAWVTGAPDLGTVETANASLQANDEWRKVVDRAGHAFQPGVTQTLLRRLN